MTRKELLTQEKAIAETILLKDSKFIKRSIQEIENEIDDQKEALQERLSSTEVVEKATIEIAYKSLILLKEKLTLYKNFKEEFYKE